MLEKPERPIRPGIIYFYCCLNSSFNYPQAAFFSNYWQNLPPLVFHQFCTDYLDQWALKDPGTDKHRSLGAGRRGSTFRQTRNPCNYLCARDKWRWLLSHQSHHTQCLFSHSLNQTLLIYFDFFFRNSEPKKLFLSISVCPLLKAVFNQLVTSSNIEGDSPWLNQH